MDTSRQDAGASVRRSRRTPCGSSGWTRLDTAGRARTIAPRVPANTPEPSRRPAGAGVRISAMPTRTAVTNAAGVVTHETTYDVNELAEILGASHRTVRRRVAGEYWPHIRGKGGRILFTSEHVRIIVRAFNESHDYPAHEPARGWEA